jgi:hypothetical protein
MTLKEFKNLEKVCKDAWTELSITGDIDKSESLDGYLNRCPACHISAVPIEYESHRFYINGIYKIQNCQLCPIDKWRSFAKNAVALPGDAVCDIRGEYFYMWRKSEDIEKRKFYARVIASLNWTYLPEYEDIPKVD